MVFTLSGRIKVEQAAELQRLLGRGGMHDDPGRSTCISVVSINKQQKDVTRGDLMTSKTRGNGVFQAMGWGVGSVIVLLLISAGLKFFAQQALGQEASEARVATMLLALYLASWLYVLGIVGLVLLSVRWLMGWQRIRVKRAAMTQYAPAEPRSRRLKKPEVEGPLSFQQGVAPVVPSRSPKESVDENEPNRLTRVA